MLLRDMVQSIPRAHTVCTSLPSALTAWLSMSLCQTLQNCHLSPAGCRIVTSAPQDTGRGQCRLLWEGRSEGCDLTHSLAQDAWFGMEKLHTRLCSLCKVPGVSHLL